ncbi:S41 family peptidase [Sinanaerobacter sp. ZZT-01]|uniref:S41 family peptidase n=1 Tax=Sinanaerobacter sp. ZZT-01 TaxID=3111540 RepID=UPI002D774311|nr:S41 family peptidase [Sinanaerobacter sp. ZZT-01]WRR93490.1 S41 family peptidase [Sinanaerobacter sp. ZZT-01]
MISSMQNEATKKMIVIKKRNLIFLLIVTLLIGGAASAWFYNQNLESSEGVTISKRDYAVYKKLEEKYAKLEELRGYIEENYYVPVDEDKLEEGIYKGLFYGTGDPYSAYLNKKEYDELLISTTGEYSGIGVSIVPDAKGYISVVAPMDDSPAANAGIKTGDKILKVDDKEYTADTIDAAVSAMRGAKGSKISVTILRDGEVKDLTMQRATIVTKTVKSEVMGDNIGYLRITGFEEKTADDFKKALRDMEVKGVKGLVIDLRDNPGGLVDISVNIADALLDSGTVTYTEDRKGEKVYYKSKEGKTSLPYVVLVNGGSASSSEILAAAIKDNHGGKLIGTKTFGKGIIQEINELQNGDAMKLTVMQYFSPNGDVIHEKGIEPDISIDLEESDFTDGVLTNDRQLQKALELLK